MRKIAFLLLAFAACKDDGTPPITFTDGGNDGGGMICNPLTQSGCSTGEKCTWINDQDNPPIGHVGCAPEGGVGGTPIALGGACTDPVAGPMGYDDCAKGSVCLSGECKQICDINGGTPACDENHACSRYADFFESGGTAVAGVCDPGCDPLTQDLKVGANKTACGSPNGAMPNKGCYGFSEYSCAPSGMTSWPLTDRMMPQTNAAGNPYLNGCAPGFIPLFYEMTGSTKTLCTGFCSALEMDNVKPAANAKGNMAASGKLPTQMAPTANMGNATCNADKKGSEASSQCRFLWPYLEDDATGELPVAFDQGPYRDTLGVCMSIAHFMYDSNNDMTPDKAYPSCSPFMADPGLPPRSAATTGDADDAADWGCQLRANSQLTSTGKSGLNPALKNVRLPKQTEMELLRHAFD